MSLQSEGSRSPWKKRVRNGPHIAPLTSWPDRRLLLFPIQRHEDYRPEEGRPSGDEEKAHSPLENSIYD
jgi:hypothetical protein